MRRRDPQRIRTLGPPRTRLGRFAEEHALNRRDPAPPPQGVAAFGQSCLIYSMRLVARFIREVAGGRVVLLARALNVRVGGPEVSAAQSATRE